MPAAEPLAAGLAGSAGLGPSRFSRNLDVFLANVCNNYFAKFCKSQLRSACGRDNRDVGKAAVGGRDGGRRHHSGADVEQAPPASRISAVSLKMYDREERAGVFFKQLTHLPISPINIIFKTKLR